MTMNLWLMSVMLYLMGFIIFHGETGIAATSTSCPVKSEINLRGPPGIPGRQGPTGLGQKGEKGERGLTDQISAEISQIQANIKEIKKNMSKILDTNDQFQNLPHICERIHSNRTDNYYMENGIYYLRDNNNFMYPAYCDMNIDGGGWTLVATIHENNIRDSGRCTTGDKWSSEHGNKPGSQTGAEAWFNYATFGNVISATSEDYKNPAYFGIQARDVMIWQVPNDTPLQQFDSAAYLKFRTTNGFLSQYGGNMFNLYNDYYPIKSGVYTAVSDNGPAIPVTFDKGNATELRKHYGINPQALTEAGYIEFRAINRERGAYALCPGLKARPNIGEAEHHCIGSTADNPYLRYCGDFAGLSVYPHTTGRGWNSDLALLQTTFLIFYR